MSKYKISTDFNNTEIVRSCTEVATAYTKPGNVLYNANKGGVDVITQQYKAAIESYKRVIVQYKETFKGNVAIDQLIKFHFDNIQILQELIKNTDSNLAASDSYSHCDRAMFLDSIRQAYMQIAQESFAIIKFNPKVKTGVYDKLYSSIGNVYKFLSTYELPGSIQQKQFANLAMKYYIKATEYGPANTLYMQNVIELGSIKEQKMDSTDNKTMMGIAHYHLAEEMFKSNPNGSIAHYKESIKNAPSSIDPYLRLAQIYSSSDNYDRTQHDYYYNKALSLFPRLSLAGGELLPADTQNIIFECLTGVQGFKQSQHQYKAFERVTYDLDSHIPPASSQDTSLTGEHGVLVDLPH